jgi:beta-lactam-binding protein with PASTA domain
MNESPITYTAAKSLLEQMGMKFGVSYTSETPRDTVIEEAPRIKKVKASKSQLRREANK